MSEGVHRLLEAAAIEHETGGVGHAQSAELQVGTARRLAGLHEVVAQSVLTQDLAALGLEEHVVRLVRTILEMHANQRNQHVGDGHRTPGPLRLQPADPGRAQIIRAMADAATDHQHLVLQVEVRVHQTADLADAHAARTGREIHRQPRIARHRIIYMVQFVGRDRRNIRRPGLRLGRDRQRERVLRQQGSALGARRTRLPQQHLQPDAFRAELPFPVRMRPVIPFGHQLLGQLGQFHVAERLLEMLDVIAQVTQRRARDLGAVLPAMPAHIPVGEHAERQLRRQRVPIPVPWRNPRHHPTTVQIDDRPLGLEPILGIAPPARRETFRHTLTIDRRDITSLDARDIPCRTLAFENAPKTPAAQGPLCLFNHLRPPSANKKPSSRSAHPKEHGHLGKPCIYVDTPRKRKLHSPTRRYLTGRVRSRYS